MRRTPDPARRPGGGEGAARRARRPTTSPSTCPASGSCWSGTASTRATASHHVDRFVADLDADPTGRRRRHREREVRLRRVHGLGHRRSARPSSRSATASTGRGSSSSSPGTACACSSSTRAGRSSRTTRSCGRRSTSPSTAGRSRASSASRVGSGHRPVPAARLARLPRRAHLPAQGPRPEEGTASSPRATRGAARRSSTRPTCRPGVARGQILKREPEGDRARGRDQAVPAPVHFAEAGDARRAVRHRPTSAGSADSRDPSASSTVSSTGARSGSPNFGNCSYFDSPKYNRLLDEASRLTGAERYRAYGELDVQLSRDAAPAIPFAALNALDVRLRARRLRRHEPGAST